MSCVGVYGFHEYVVKSERDRVNVFPTMDILHDSVMTRIKERKSDKGIITGRFQIPIKRQTRKVFQVRCYRQLMKDVFLLKSLLSVCVGVNGRRYVTQDEITDLFCRCEKWHHTGFLHWKQISSSGRTR